MSDTVSRQLEHLAELHADGALTDDEFAAAKATTLGPPTGSPPAVPPTIRATPDPILAAPRPSIPSKLVALLIFFASLMIGITVTGLSAGLEWAPAQAPAAPIVCPGGELVAAFDVAYTVNTKGVDFASVCMKDGEVRAISDWWLTTVMVLEYTAVAFAILYGWRLLWLRKERRHESVTMWSSTSGATPREGSADDA